MLNWNLVNRSADQRGFSWFLWVSRTWRQFSHRETCYLHPFRVRNVTYTSCTSTNFVRNYKISGTTVLVFNISVQVRIRGSVYSASTELRFDYWRISEKVDGEIDLIIIVKDHLYSSRIYLYSCFIQTVECFWKKFHSSLIFVHYETPNIAFFISMLEIITLPVLCFNFEIHWCAT